MNRIVVVAVMIAFVVLGIAGIALRPDEDPHG